jgi:hypothetical protein
VLTGRLGDDTYVVDSNVDTLVELEAQGTDLVQAGVNVDLDAAAVFEAGLAFLHSQIVRSTRKRPRPVASKRLRTQHRLGVIACPSIQSTEHLPGI